MKQVGKILLAILIFFVLIHILLKMIRFPISILFDMASKSNNVLAYMFSFIIIICYLIIVLIAFNLTKNFLYSETKKEESKKLIVAILLFLIFMLIFSYLYLLIEKNISSLLKPIILITVCYVIPFIITRKMVYSQDKNNSSDGIIQTNQHKEIKPAVKFLLAIPMFLGLMSVLSSVLALPIGLVSALITEFIKFILPNAATGNGAWGIVLFISGTILFTVTPILSFIITKKILYSKK